MLHDLIRSGDRAGVEGLLQSGADVNRKDDKHRAPLHLAAWKGDADMVELLLHYEANVKSTAMDNFTALHFASQSGSRRICEALLQRERTLLDKPTSKAGKTALHLAIGKGNVEVVRCLLEAGASKKVKTKHGENALALAWKCNTHQEEIIELIKNVNPVNCSKTPGSSPGCRSSLTKTYEEASGPVPMDSEKATEAFVHPTSESNDSGLLPSPPSRKRKRIDTTAFLSHLNDPE